MTGTVIVIITIETSAMKKFSVVLASILLMTNIYVFTQVGIEDVITIIVDPNLLPGIRSGLSQYEVDLQKEGYRVIERISDFSNPTEVRTYLQSLHETEQNLVGAMLIGNLPHAYQWFIVTYTNPSIPQDELEVISLQYYSDLDGIFEKSTGYTSPGGHEYSYDIHNGEVNWEIWTGVLPLYKGNYTATTEALNRYFIKNHAYREGEYDLPRAFSQITEHHSASTIEEHNTIIQYLTTGSYAWIPLLLSDD